MALFHVNCGEEEGRSRVSRVTSLLAILFVLCIHKITAPKQSMHWGEYKFSCCVLCREVVPFLGSSKCITTIRKSTIWDLEKCPLLRGLLCYVPISEGPLSEVLLYYTSRIYSTFKDLNVFLINHCTVPLLSLLFLHCHNYTHHILQALINTVITRVVENDL